MSNSPKSKSPDVNKTLVAYGAELDELRIELRKANERIATLEAAGPRLRIREITDEPTSESEFKPGWSEDGAVYKAGILASDQRGYGVWLQWNKKDTYAVLTIENEPLEVCFEMTPRRLHELIGAAMAVLKRMEAEQSDEN